MYKVVHIRHSYYHRFTVSIKNTVDRQLPKVLRFVIGNLLSIHRQRLSKIAITIKETYCTKVYITIRGLFQIVTGKNTQTTGIYFKNVSQAIFHTEISY